MTKGFWRLAVGASVMFFGAFVAAGPGCSSDDSAAGTDTDASTGSPDANICQLEGAFSGGPCFPVGPTLCFQQCTTGGCVCTEDKAHPGADAGIWVCQSDTSCLPDAPPVDFDATDNPPPPVDSGTTVDANVDDAGADASDAGADADADAG
jgi:hypothetical protein